MRTGTNIWIIAWDVKTVWTDCLPLLSYLGKSIISTQQDWKTFQSISASKDFNDDNYENVTHFTYKDDKKVSHEIETKTKQPC